MRYLHRVLYMRGPRVHQPRKVWLMEVKSIPNLFRIGRICRRNKGPNLHILAGGTSSKPPPVHPPPNNMLSCSYFELINPHECYYSLHLWYMANPRISHGTATHTGDDNKCTVLVWFVYYSVLTPRAFLTPFSNIHYISSSWRLWQSLRRVRQRAPRTKTNPDNLARLRLSQLYFY